ADELAESLSLLGKLDIPRSVAVLRELRNQQVALDAAKLKFGSSEIVARRIADHSLDWTRFVFDEINLPTRVAANEALMCARDDHMDPEEIARLAGVEVRRREHRRDELPVGMAAMLSGAVIDEAIGPIDTTDGVRVVWLRERRPPSLDDPTDRDPAALELLEEALERVKAGRAWALGPL
ncbi:MAG TPA: hypothetical protein VKR27_05370, partial [Acidimicrobiales bacterium]|nr:hypothetical protein [Acidimicrobiales bacterium]